MIRINIRRVKDIISKQFHTHEEVNDFLAPYVRGVVKKRRKNSNEPPRFYTGFNRPDDLRVLAILIEWGTGYSYDGPTDLFQEMWALNPRAVPIHHCKRG